MRPDIESINFRDGIDFGIFTLEADKADNHNRGVTVPQRQFIPLPGDNPESISGFSKKIDDKIRRIIDGVVDGG